MVHVTRRVAVLGAAVALVLAGCSADEEPETAETSEPTAAATTAAPTPEPVETESTEEETKAVEDMTLEELEERAGSVDYDAAQEALGQGQYAADADPATCDAVFGDEEDGIMAMFLDSQNLTDPTEALAFIDDTVARIDEVAADAPADMKADLELLGESLSRSATFDGQSDLAQIVADTESAMTGIAESCFGA